MLTGRPKIVLELSAEEEAELRGFSTSRSLPHALVARAKLVLWSAEGESNTDRITVELDEGDGGQVASALCGTPLEWSL